MGKNTSEKTKAKSEKMKAKSEKMKAKSEKMGAKREKMGVKICAKYEKYGRIYIQKYIVRYIYKEYVK